MDGSIWAVPPKNDVLECILGGQLENTRSFLDLLERERMLLAVGNMDDLASLVADKDRIVNQLARLDAQLDQLLVAMGLPGGAQGMNAWIVANHSASAISRDWEKLLDLARLARQLNQTNANIISTWLRHTRQTLNVLHNAAGYTTLYDPRGQMA